MIHLTALRVIIQGNMLDTVSSVSPIHAQDTISGKEKETATALFYDVL